MTLIAKKNALLATLSQFKDTQERFAYVVERGRRLPPLADSFRAEEFRVEGCLAKLWIVPEFIDGKCYYRTDSDSAIMKGVSTVLCEFYSGQKPEEIVSVDPSFLGQVGITQHLTQNRRNGLARVWETIRGFAEDHLKMEPPPAPSPPSQL